jgi:hypothetical protein
MPGARLPYQRGRAVNGTFGARWVGATSSRSWTTAPNGWSRTKFRLHDQELHCLFGRYPCGFPEFGGSVQVVG